MDVTLEPDLNRDRCFGIKDLACILLLLVLGCKLTWDIFAIRDCRFSDESEYMQSAVFRLPPDPEYSPLYIQWYRLLTDLGLPRVAVPWLNWWLMVLLLPVATYLVARRIGARRLPALLAGTLLLTAGLPDVVPFPMHLTTLFLASGTLIATLFRSWRWSLAALAITVAVTVYLRPEFVLPTALLGLFGVAAWVWSMVRMPQGRARRLLPAGLVAVVLIGFAALWGVPGVKGNRTFIAFAQHYGRAVGAVRGISTTESIHDPFRLFQEDFGPATTCLEAFRANPHALLWHVRFNLSRVPLTLDRNFVPRLDLPPNRHVVVQLFLGVVGLLSIWGLRRKWRTGAGRPLLLCVSTIILVAVPLLVQSLLIRPRDHYLLPITVLILGLFAAGLSAWLEGRGLRPADSWRALLITGALLLAITPNRAHGWNVQQLVHWRPKNSYPQMQVWPVLHLVRGLHIQRPVVVVSHQANPFVAFFSDLDYRMVSHADKQEGFREFLDRHDVGLVLVDARMLTDPLYAGDSEFQEMVHGQSDERYAVYSLEGAATPFVLVRRDVLPLPDRAPR